MSPPVGLRIEKSLVVLLSTEGLHSGDGTPNLRIVLALVRDVFDEDDAHALQPMHTIEYNVTDSLHAESWRDCCPGRLGEFEAPPYSDLSFYVARALALGIVSKLGEWPSWYPEEPPAF